MLWFEMFESVLPIDRGVETRDFDMRMR